MHTGTLMRMRKESYIGVGIASFCNQGQGVTTEKGWRYTAAEIKHELSKREHAPNKADRKAARQAAAKRGK